MSMNITGIVVTGVGGGAGQSVLKCLKDSSYRVIAVDGLVDATGLYMVEQAYVGEFAKSEHFVARLLEICRQAQANVIFSGLDAELIPLAQYQDIFKAQGIEVIVSSSQVVDLADDKYLTAKFLKDHGFLTPRTEIAIVPDLQFPVVVKPRKGGARSVGVVICHNQGEVEGAVKKHSTNFVIQEFIDGNEYTCGTLNWQGVCYGVIPMQRSLRSGDTYKAYTEKNPMIMNYVKNVVETLKPYGPFNVQLKFKDNQCYIFEFNARCSGTTAARALAGFNEPLWICKALEEGVCAPLDFKEIVVLRYWNELVVDHQDIQALRQQGEISRAFI